MSLNELFIRYHDDVEFMMIYIREAHPVDGWWFGKGLPKLLLKLFRSKAATHLYDPKSMEERQKAAGECETALKYGIGTYVDDMEDTVNKAYAAWPTRIYLIGLDGKVVYPGGLGPFGFKPAELKNSIEEYVHINGAVEQSAA